MEITEIRVKLVNVKNDKLRAFCSITVDNDFVIRDLKVIEGTKGAFVAMPSRKLTDRCRCGGKNHYRARFCNDCGARLSGERGMKTDRGNQKLHTDIAHPINSRCREVIQKKVLEVYQVEMEKSQSPDYKPMEFDVFDEEALVEESSAEMGVEVERGEPMDPARESGREEPRDGEGNIPPPMADAAIAGPGPEVSGAGRSGEHRPEGGRDRGRDGDRRMGPGPGQGPRDQGPREQGPREQGPREQGRGEPGRSDPGRGRFRRGGGAPAPGGAGGGSASSGPGGGGPGGGGPGGGGPGGGGPGGGGPGGGGPGGGGPGGGGPGGGGRRRDDRERGRPDQRRGNGHGPDRGGDRRPGPGRESIPEIPGKPDRDRDQFLPSQAPAASGSAISPIGPPPASRPRSESDPEPEDNFGAGLFS